MCNNGKDCTFMANTVFDSHSTRIKFSGTAPIPLQFSRRSTEFNEQQWRRARRSRAKRPAARTPPSSYVSAGHACAPASCITRRWFVAHTLLRVLSCLWTHRATRRCAASCSARGRFCTRSTSLWPKFAMCACVSLCTLYGACDPLSLVSLTCSFDIATGSRRSRW